MTTIDEQLAHPLVAMLNIEPENRDLSNLSLEFLIRYRYFNLKYKNIQLINIMCPKLLLLQFLNYESIIFLNAVIHGD